MRGCPEQEEEGEVDVAHVIGMLSEFALEILRVGQPCACGRVVRVSVTDVSGDGAMQSREEPIENPLFKTLSNSTVGIFSQETVLLIDGRPYPVGMVSPIATEFLLVQW